MSAIAVAAVAAGVTGAVALAAPGQCSLTGYDSFECDVALDGGGLTFALPDGQTFAFALVAADEGLGYLIAPDAAPGERPDELGSFAPVAGKPGCWANQAREPIEFCAAIAQ